MRERVDRAARAAPRAARGGARLAARGGGARRPGGRGARARARGAAREAALAGGAARAAAAPPSLALAFADQGGNAAGLFFQASLLPYLLYLYFLGYKGNDVPPQALFGFQYLLLFVLATIPTGIISKTVYGCSLADVDWLHGTAESLLTVTNLLIGVRPPRRGRRRDARGAHVARGGGGDRRRRGRARGRARRGARGRAGGQGGRGRGQGGGRRQGPFAPSPQLTVANATAIAGGGLVQDGALALAALAFATAFVGGPISHLFEAHTPFLAGVGDMPALAFSPEPANALSLPTWVVHFSSVFEFIFVMQLCWRLAAVRDNPAWKGLTWGLLPLHASGVVACRTTSSITRPTSRRSSRCRPRSRASATSPSSSPPSGLAASNGWTVAELNLLPALAAPAPASRSRGARPAAAARARARAPTLGGRDGRAARRARRAAAARARRQAHGVLGRVRVRGQVRRDAPAADARARRRARRGRRVKSPRRRSRVAYNFGKDAGWFGDERGGAATRALAA